MTLEELIKNKSDVIELKKNTFKQCDPFTTAFASSNITNKSVVTKANKDTLNVTVVGNTYNWMDSHDDMHVDGIFTKTISESGHKVLHLHDHIQQLSAKVGRPQKVYEKQIAWRELGVDKDGTTTSLMMDSEVVKNYNPIIFDQYENKEIDQHSVGMQYVKIALCINDKNEKEEYANWNKYFPMMGNPERAEEKGYFFAITEAKLKEISCVIAGSNELTPTLNNKDIEPLENTQKTEADSSHEITLEQERRIRLLN